MATDPVNHRRAREAVAGAIRRGEMARPTHCEACGVQQEIRPARASYRVVYHHPITSYEPGKWLAGLIMLCRSCHAKVHRGGMPEPGTGAVWEMPEGVLGGYRLRRSRTAAARARRLAE